MIPDYQTSARHWDVLQAQYGVTVPELQVGTPQLSDQSAGDFILILYKNWLGLRAEANYPSRYEEQFVRDKDQEQGGDRQ